MGVLLAGGEARRFGADKATATLAGTPLVERAYRALAAVCDEVVVADRGRRLVADAQSIDDEPVAGPAGGILAAQRHFPQGALLVSSCDLPLVSTDLLAWLAARPDDLDWVVPRVGGRLQPLCARYGTRALAALRRQIARGELALRALEGRAGLRIAVISEEDLRPFGAAEDLFCNINTREDLRRCEAILARRISVEDP